MKVCENCGALLDDFALYCSECKTKQGTYQSWDRTGSSQAETGQAASGLASFDQPQEETSDHRENSGGRVRAFCSSCGAKLDSNARFCAFCGMPVANADDSFAKAGRVANTLPELLKTISGRIQTVGVMGIVLGSIQICVVFVNFVLLIGRLIPQSFWNWINLLFLALLGVFNLYGSCRTVKYSDAALKDPGSLLKNYADVGNHIFVLVWNSVYFLVNLIDLNPFGILLMGYGVAVSIIDLTYVRNYIMNHKAQIKEMMRLETA